MVLRHARPGGGSSLGREPSEEGDGTFFIGNGPSAGRSANLTSVSDPRSGASEAQSETGALAVDATTKLIGGAINARQAALYSFR